MDFFEFFHTITPHRRKKRSAFPSALRLYTSYDVYKKITLSEKERALNVHLPPCAPFTTPTTAITQ
jgi:hypothetical protein